MTRRVVIILTLFCCLAACTKSTYKIDPESSQSLSFSYGYCEAVSNYTAQQNNGAALEFTALNGHERAYSTGAFAARQDIRLEKYKSLSAINSICKNLHMISY